MRVELVIPGVPIAQPRTRSTKSGHHYTPDNGVLGFKEAIKFAFREQYQGAPAEGPVILHITAIFPRPKRLTGKNKPPGRIPHLVRPDYDNLEKSATDALSKLAFCDDSQVYYATAMKFYAASDEQPHTRIVIDAND